MITKTTFNHFPTLKLHIYRYPDNILEEPESEVTDRL